MQNNTPSARGNNNATTAAEDADNRSFLIRPFKAAVVIRQHATSNGMDDMLSNLNKAIVEIHTKNSSSLSFEELYRAAYGLVLHKQGKDLYDATLVTMTMYMTTLSPRVLTLQDVSMMSVTADVWEEHKVTMVMVRDILMYMDRTYCPSADVSRCYEFGLELFYSHIMGVPDFKARLLSFCLDAIERERNSEVPSRDLLSTLLAMYLELGAHSTRIYNSDFEGPFLAATAAYYNVEAQTFLEQNTCPSYLKKASDRLSEELARVSAYLSPTTKPKLMALMEATWITSHASDVIELEGSGLRVMMATGKVQDLTLLWSLFSRVPDSLKLIRTHLCTYARELGEDCMRRQDEMKDPTKFVDELLALRHQFADVITQAFGNDLDAQVGLKDAFQSFMNKTPECACHLASYCDALLKSGCRTLNEVQLEVALEKCMTLFRYLYDKDVFESYYRQALSKRFLIQTSGKALNEDVEKLMMAKLKHESGHQFTSKLEGMFKDMKQAKDTMMAFQATAAPKKIPFNLNVEVLTSGYWPVLSEAAEMQGAMVLHPELKTATTKFESFYAAQYSGRTLKWQFDLGSGEVRGRFGPKTYELLVSTLQVHVLLLFQTSDLLTFEDIVASCTHVPLTLLKRHLISLCTPKHRILRKSSKGKDIELTDTVSYNPSFQSKHYRVKISLISVANDTTGVFSTTIPAPVEEDRKHLIEASLVRIMKARKTLGHSNLVAEVTKQLQKRFTPTPQLIKCRIECLIERDYLKRSDDDRRVYHYMA